MYRKKFCTKSAGSLKQNRKALSFNAVCGLITKNKKGQICSPPPKIELKQD